MTSHKNVCVGGYYKVAQYFSHPIAVAMTRGPFLEGPEKFSHPESHNLEAYDYRAVLGSCFIHVS